MDVPTASIHGLFLCLNGHTQTQQSCHLRAYEHVFRGFPDIQTKPYKHEKTGPQIGSKLPEKTL